MKIMSISASNSIKQNNNSKTKFGMSMHIEETAHNLIAKGIRERTIDPIEWLATAHALAKDKAHYLISRKENTSFWESLAGDKFVITRFGENNRVNSRVSDASQLLQNIQALDPSIQGEIQYAKLIADNNIIKNTEYLGSGNQKVLTDERTIDLQKGLLDQSDNNKKVPDAK